jgi:hypothetical protein
VNLSICLLKVIQNSLFSEKKDANRMFVVILKDIADFVFIVILCEITEEKKNANKLNVIRQSEQGNRCKKIGKIFFFLE